MAGGSVQGREIGKRPRSSGVVAGERGGGLIRGGRLTKAAGMVASMAPLAGGAGLLVSVAAIGMLAQAAAAQEGSPPSPDCVTVSGSDAGVSEYTCSGSYIQTPQRFEASAGKRLKVTLGSQTNAGSAGLQEMFYLKSHDGIEFQQLSPGNGFIHSAGNAIHARKLIREQAGEGGSGPAGGGISISFAGKISSGSTGVYAVNEDRAGDVTIAVGNVYARANAVHAVSRSSGGISIRTAGSVSSRRGHAIRAQGLGTGAVSVRASGGVYGREKDAIYASGSGGISIQTAGSVYSGAGHGIRARGSGTGAVSVRSRASKIVYGREGHGIYASGVDGEVTVSAALVYSRSGHGIRVRGSGTGAVSVRTYAYKSYYDYGVSGREGHGIYASGAGAISIRAGGSCLLQRGPRDTCPQQAERRCRYQHIEGRLQPVRQWNSRRG